MRRGRRDADIARAARRADRDAAAYSDAHHIAAVQGTLCYILRCAIPWSGYSATLALACCHTTKMSCPHAPAQRGDQMHAPPQRTIQSQSQSNLPCNNISQGRLVSDGIIKSKDDPRFGPAPPARPTPAQEQRILERLSAAEADGSLLFALPHEPEGCGVHAIIRNHSQSFAIIRNH